MNEGMNVQKRKWVVFSIVLIVLIIDQAVKFWVKTNMTLHESFGLFGDSEWARIYFIENPGMAFGLEFGGRSGKLFLSIFRIFAVSFLGYYIVKLIKMPIRNGLLVCFALILAGAIGNIIDSVFYGKIFSVSNHVMIADFMPENGGYDTWLHGKVVDMLHFPMWNGVFPEWFPFWGGEKFTFFRPVFNIADAAISIGVFTIVLFHRGFFIDDVKDSEEDAEESADISSEEE